MLTRAAMAKAQEEAEGGGAGEDDVERIDEAIMGLQVKMRCAHAHCRGRLAYRHRGTHRFRIKRPNSLLPNPSHHS